MELVTMPQAMQLHAQIIKCGPYGQCHSKNLSKLFTFSALSPSGDLSYARHILESLESSNSYYYNTMIRAYSDCSDQNQALALFLVMHSHGDMDSVPRPDKFTYPFVIRVCSNMRLARLGKQLHGLILKSGFGWDTYVQNALIHMYSGFGDSGLALKVFEKMSNRDVVSWTSMIDGFVDCDRPLEAMKLFEQMMDEGVDPNEVTIVSVLRACSDVGGLSLGQKVHKVVDEKRLGSKANVKTALIDMYAKCGSLDSAILVFDETVDKDAFVWTAMIAGLASHGRSKEAIDFYERMKSAKIMADERTMTAVLSACRNAGWVSEGLFYLKNIRETHDINPTIQHYGCIADLLARTGNLKEAERFIRKLPVEPDAVLWRSLLWGCKFHGDAKRGERLMENLKLSETESTDCGSYVLLGNLYASTGKWHQKAKIREIMNQRGIVKRPGTSRIEIDGVVHEFIAGDSTHIQASIIYEKLDEIEQNLTNRGYCPALSEVLLEIDDEEKAAQLLHHSEKLAVAFGLIKTSSGYVIRIVKNLRSCSDCHSFMKLISKIYQREIIVRDRIRFHHFKNGECSCVDYW